MVGARTIFAGAIALAGVDASSQQAPQELSPGAQHEATDVEFPRTAQEHLAAADEYARKAAERREEADRHRRMLAAFERLLADLAALPAPPQKRGKTFPSRKRRKESRDPVAEYRAHCQAYTLAAEVMAGEAETLAEFHRARARELRETKDR